MFNVGQIVLLDGKPVLYAGFSVYDKPRDNELFNRYYSAPGVFTDLSSEPVRPIRDESTGKIWLGPFVTDNKLECVYFGLAKTEVIEPGGKCCASLEKALAMARKSLADGSLAPYSNKEPK